VEDARNTVATAYASGLLEDEEFLKLYDDFKPLYPSYSYWDFDPFSLDSFDSYECEAHFRVVKHDLWMLFRFRKLLSVHEEQFVVEWKGSARCLND